MVLMSIFNFKRDSPYVFRHFAQKPQLIFLHFDEELETDFFVKKLLIFCFL